MKYRFLKVGELIYADRGDEFNDKNKGWHKTLNGNGRFKVEGWNVGKYRRPVKGAKRIDWKVFDYKDFEKLVKKSVAEKTNGGIKELSDSEILRLWLFLSAFPKALRSVMNDLRRGKNELSGFVHPSKDFTQRINLQ